MKNIIELREFYDPDSNENVGERVYQENKWKGSYFCLKLKSFFCFNKNFLGGEIKWKKLKLWKN